MMMRHRFALGVLFVVVASWLSTAAGHEGEHHDHGLRRFTSKEQFAPKPLPDRVVLSWGADPRTSIDVTWRTEAMTEESVAEYAPADTLLGSMPDGNVPHAKRVEGSQVEFESDLGVSRMHSVRLNDLKPGTMYAYRVGNGQHWSEWFQFRTASDGDEPFTFVYFGDAQNAVRLLWSRVIREANQYAPRAAFMLHAGDLVNDGREDALWGEWFEAGGWLNGMIPVVATPGNHEYRGGGLAPHWRPQFAFPLNGPSGLEETAYWFDYQGARIISLNSNERIEEQQAWLADVLNDENRPKWTIVTFHHPVFSAAKDRDNPDIRNAWRPIFEKDGVDLVLQGHDHAYARSGLGGPSNVPEGVRVQDSNTVYVVSVSGPKQYPLEESWDVSRVASGAQLFQVVHVSPEEIRYEARLATGELYDAFTLAKSANGKSELQEEIPPRAEIRQ